MRTIGIDIGSFSVKVAEIDISSRGNTLKDFYEFELTHEPGQDTRFQTVEILKKITSNYDLKYVRTVVGLGMEHVSTRTLEFPFTERRKILQSLPFELEDNVPFSQDDAVFDFRVVSTRQNRSNVLAVAVPKKYVQEILALCDDAGFDPDVIAPNSLSLSNYFAAEFAHSPSPIEPGELTESGIYSHSEIFIHLGYKKTLLNITRQGSIVSSRAFYFGSADLANSLSKAYQLPYLEALKGANEKAFVLTTTAGADPSQVAFSEVITETFSPLLTDIKRSLVDLKSQFKLNFTACYVSGGVSGILNLGPYIAQEIGVPTAIKNPPSRSPQAMPLVSDAKFNDKIAMVAIGLALEGARKPKAPAINFRKNEFSKQSQNLKIFLENNKNLIRGTLVVLIAFFTYSFMRGSFAQENIDSLDVVMADQAKNNTIGLTKGGTKTEALNKFVRTKKNELEGRKEVVKLNQTLSALDVLKNISSAMPSKDQVKLDLRNFQITEDQVTLAGMVSSVEEFVLFQRKISQLPQVSNIKASPFPAPQGKYGFQMTFNMKHNRAAGK